jgi:hypothetical protein
MLQYIDDENLLAITTATPTESSIFPKGRFLLEYFKQVELRLSPELYTKVMQQYIQKIQSCVKVAVHEISHFSVSPEIKESHLVTENLTKILALQDIIWLPKYFKYFRLESRQRVFFLLCVWRLTSHLFASLPKEVIYVIFSFSETQDLAKKISKKRELTGWLKNMCPTYLKRMYPDSEYFGFIELYMYCQEKYRGDLIL